MNIVHPGSCVWQTCFINLGHSSGRCTTEPHAVHELRHEPRVGHRGFQGQKRENRLLYRCLMLDRLCHGNARTLVHLCWGLQRTLTHGSQQLQEVEGCRTAFQWKEQNSTSSNMTHESFMACLDLDAIPLHPHSIN